MTAPLYEISKELAQINDELIEAQGEMSQELEQRLDSLNLSLVEKATGIRKIIAMVEADALGRNAEIKRLQAISKIHDNGLERLKAYIKKNMEVADKKKIETPIGTFTIAKNPASVDINKDILLDMALTDLPYPDNITPEEVAINMTPAEYRISVPATWTPDKKLIKAALEEGYDVPGWKLITDKTNLRIK
jgi:Siphovirus Gp157